MVRARNKPPARRSACLQDDRPSRGRPSVGILALAFVYSLLVRLAGKTAKGAEPPADQVDGWRRAGVVLEVLQTYERRSEARGDRARTWAVPAVGWTLWRASRRVG